MGLIKVYKPVGLTPYDIIKDLKKIQKYQNTKMSYAGRLDPMAHGLMIILTDKECLNQYIYNNVDKIYQFKLLIGVQTDTYDILGLITNNCKTVCVNKIDEIYDKIYNLTGLIDQEYPLFSSKRYNGKPLWYYGKNNLTHLIKEYPKHKVEIKNIEIKETNIMSKSILVNYVNENINKLCKSKQFRQNEILKKWDNINDIPYNILDIEVKVSSGTYIRGISKYLSDELCIPTLCLDIYRKNILL